MTAKGQSAKNGPGRFYDDDQLDLFARYREHREPYAPKQCDRGGAAGPCWVACGPPAISQGGLCLGCGGRPKSMRVRGF
jgi:hypothetical protein